MALPLDEGIKRRVDAYRDNPAALEKNYQMNQELLDLLALQKIKSEKDAAARELQMSQQQNPQTIAQQRGEEAINRTKEDIAKQVGGIAAQQQQQQRGGPPPGPPPGPQMAGIANQPAPNMARMAGGGIVTFQAGTEVNVSDEDLAKMKVTKRAWEAMSAQDKAIRLAAIRGEPMPQVEGADPTLRGRKGSMRPALDAAGAQAAARDLYGNPIARSITGRSGFEGISTAKDRLEQAEAAQRKRENIRQQGMSARQLAQLNPITPFSNPTPAQNAGILAEQKRMQQGQLGLPAGSTPPAQTPQTAPAYALSNPQMNKPSTILPEDKTGLRAALDPNLEGRAASNEGLMRGAAFGLQSRVDQDPTAARTTARGAADKYLNRSGIADLYGKQLGDRQALNQRLAADRKSNNLYDLLSYAGGEGALANIGRAATDRRRAEQLQNRADLEAEQAIEQKGTSADINVAKAALAEGRSAFEITSADRQNATTAQTTLFNSIGRSISDTAKRGLDVTKANMTAEQKEDALKMQKAIAQLGANAKIAVAEYNGKIMKRGQDIDKLVKEATDRKTLLGAQIQVDKELAKVDSDIAAQVIEAAKLDVKLMKLTGPERDAEIKRLTEIARLANKQTRTSLLRTQKLIRRRLTGSLNQPGGPPSAVQGFTP